MLFLPLAEFALQQIEGSVLIEVYLVGGCPPQRFTSFLDKLPSRVSSSAYLTIIQLPIPERVDGNSPTGSFASSFCQDCLLLVVSSCVECCPLQLEALILPILSYG